MSAALIEAPVTNPSQLFFTWPETEIEQESNFAADCDLLGDVLPAKSFATTATTAKTSMAKSPAASTRSFQQPVAGKTEAFGERRVGEVRIGSVMIKLLKRYGITDDEIAEGLADYAKKTCQSVAS